MKLYAAILYVADLEASLEFYESFLGLTPDEPHDGTYASLPLEDGVQLGLKLAEEEREVPGAQTVTIACEDIRELYQKANSSGIAIHQELEEASWGTTFNVLDPDGNKIEFMQNQET